MKKRFAVLLAAALILFASAASALNTFMYIEKIDIKTNKFQKRYKTSAPLNVNTEKSYLSFVFNYQTGRSAETAHPRAEITMPTGVVLPVDWGTVSIPKNMNSRYFLNTYGMNLLLYPGDYTVSMYDGDKLLETQVMTFTGERPQLSWLDDEPQMTPGNETF